MSVAAIRRGSGGGVRRPADVVILNDFLYVQGGASRVAVDEAVGLAEAGINVTFLGAKGPACAELQHPRIRAIDLGQKELLEAGRSLSVIAQSLWNVASDRAMDALLDGLDPKTTVIHLHGYTKALTLTPVRRAAKRGFRVVCTLHDFFAACPNGAFFDYTANAPCTRTALSLNCMGANCDKRSRAQKAYRVGRGLVQRHAIGFPGHVHHYISLSEQSAELLRPYLPRDARITRLDNVIPVERQTPVDVAGNATLVAVGRLDREKGIEVLLEAAKIASVGITFVGEGPLRPLVEGTPGMTVTGWRTAQEVAAELAKARALVFPSLWYETFGLVVSEAAAKGVPSIVSDVSAASERVRDGHSGWIVRAGDAHDLARALTEALDADCAAALGLAAYEDFWAHPSDPHSHTQRLLGIYEEMLDSTAPRRAAPHPTLVEQVQ